MLNKPLKLVFAGTPLIAQTILHKIKQSGFNIDLVLTQPDRPANRGKKLTASPVKEFALNNNIPLLQPISFKHDQDAISRIRELKPDLFVVVAYGLILPQELLAIPKLGCVNVHVSLLPKHRGAAPIQRAILAGDKTTGVTLMQMDAGLDTGDILLQQKIDILDNETSGELTNKLALIGADLLIEYLNNYAAIKPIPQNSENASYAHKIDKIEAQLNWCEEASIIQRKIRGFNPQPGCFTYLDETLVKIWRAKAVEYKAHKAAVPGTIVVANTADMIVACGNNSFLAVHEIQEAGKNRQLMTSYLKGRNTLIGRKFV